MSRDAGGGAMDGWCSVEELTRWGFAHTPVLMANEAPEPLACWPADAVIVSTDNALS